MAYVTTESYDPEVLKRLQAVELEIIHEFVRICDKHSINYFGVFGTAIGTVRHHGFIPWDDDIDFAMLREDYEKFVAVAEQESGGRYLLAGPDCGHRYYNFVTKFYDSQTVFQNLYSHGAWPMGINIDIFVYDTMAPLGPARDRQVARANRIREIHMAKNVNFFKWSANKKGNLVPRLAAGAGHCLLNLLPFSLDRYCEAYKANACAHTGETDVYTQFCDSQVLESALTYDQIFPLVKMPFEDIEINLPHDYDGALRKMYGDYMQLPPEDKRANHYPWLLKFSPDGKAYGTSVS